MKTIKMFALILCMLLPFACFSCKSGNGDITGYYTAEQLNNVYYFAPDGKIYENYSEESNSCYKVDGAAIKLYNEEAPNVIMEFDFTKTENGFIMGELEYTKIEDPFENKEKLDAKEDDEVKEEAAPDEEATSEEESGTKEIVDITGYYLDEDGYTCVFAENGMFYEKSADESDIAWEYDGEVLIFRNINNNKVEINGVEIIEGGIKIGDKVYLSME